jgi:Heterokaryon incompatibility protein (HET)
MSLESEDLRKYQHQPLTEVSIRLLTLEPGTTSDPITCQLNHVSFMEEPTYEALSYVWGDASDTLQIRCSNSVLDITANLYAALLHLRSSDKQRVLWVDAICIDQESPQERSQQVKIMDRI